MEPDGKITNGLGPWEGGCQDIASVKVSRWADLVSNSWGCNQESKDLGRGWEYGLSRNSMSLNDKEWRHRGEDEWRRKQWESQNNPKNNLDFRMTNSGRGARNDGGHQYKSGNKSSRFQGSDYQTGNYWSRGNNRKRSVLR